MFGDINKIKREMELADAVVIGAGAGLSAAAGFDYKGKRFKENFSDFIDKYKFKDMYLGGFYMFDTLEEKWAYWSRYIYINRYKDKDNGTYKKLFELIKNKEYFVLTTNVDHQFQKAGFDKKRLFYTQGDYGLFQCGEPCCDKTYDNEEAVLQMVEQQKNMRIPKELIPYCPVCKKPMSMNLRADNTFVQDSVWYKARERYAEFIEKHKNMRILFLELGVGMNTPGVIKYNFWDMTKNFSNAHYVCVNCGGACAPFDIVSKSLCINDDIKRTIEKLYEKSF